MQLQNSGAEATRPIIVTRMAIQWKGNLPSHAWVSERFDLWTHTTMPSLAAQDIANLPIALLVHPSYYTFILNQISKIRKSQLKLHVVRAFPAADFGGVDFVSDLRIQAKDLAAIAPGTRNFLTFRLDSDDMLMPGVVNKALKMAEILPPGSLIDMPIGYQLDLCSAKTYFLTYEPTYQGPFLAIKNASRQSMLNIGGNHILSRKGRIISKIQERSWWQLIHKSNKANRIAAIQSDLFPQESGELAFSISARSTPCDSACLGLFKKNVTQLLGPNANNLNEHVDYI